MTENFKDIEDIEEVEEIELPIEHETIGRLVSVPDAVIDAVTTRTQQINTELDNIKSELEKAQKEYEELKADLQSRDCKLRKEFDELNGFIVKSRVND